MARREFPTVLELVGNTPIVRLARPVVTFPESSALEYLNPGGSVKDRIGLAMVEAAERDGRLRQGGRSSSRPSGTPASDSRSPQLRGYRCIFVMPDKMSQEKISMLRAYGAEVVITPTAVDPHSPGATPSASVRRRLQARPVLESSNPEAHYETTRRSSGSRPTAGTSTPSSSPSGRAGRSPSRPLLPRSTARGPGSSPSTPRSPRTRAPLRPLSRRGNRKEGPTRSTRPWSTSGCAYRIATRSSRRKRLAREEVSSRRLHWLHGVGGPRRS